MGRVRFGTGEDPRAIEPTKERLPQGRKFPKKLRDSFVFPRDARNWLYDSPGLFVRVRRKTNHAETDGWLPVCGEKG